MMVKSTTITTSTKSALTNDEINESVHVCSSGRCMDAAYQRMQDAYSPDDGKSNVAHDGTGCTLLDNAGAHCPDVPSTPLL